MADVFRFKVNFNDVEGSISVFFIDDAAMGGAMLNPAPEDTEEGVGGRLPSSSRGMRIFFVRDTPLAFGIEALFDSLIRRTGGGAVLDWGARGGLEFRKINVDPCFKRCKKHNTWR